MSLTESKSLEMGRKAPNFSLLNVVTNKMNTLDELKGKEGTVVMFICNHCPFVVHINQGLVQLANDYIPKGIGFIAISSNDIVTHPQDAPEHMKEVSSRLNYPFPYLYDESQEVAKAYEAVCTPDLYLFDNNLKTLYHGQFDGARPGNQISVTGEDLRHAIDSLLRSEANTNPQKPSIGCNIKWKL